MFSLAHNWSQRITRLNTPPPPPSNWVISEFIRYDYDKMEQKGISGSAAI